MPNRIPKIMDLLPKKQDCCDCGHCTCEVYAMELVAGRVTIDACPVLSHEARRMLSQVLKMENDLRAALQGITPGRVLHAAEPAIMLPARIAGLLLVLLPFAAVLWILTAWIFMK